MADRSTSVSGAHTHRFERAIGLLTIVLPTLGVVVALAHAFTYGVSAFELGLCVAMYTLTVVALEVGYHRMVVHRSFNTHGWLRALLVTIGSMGTIGPIGWWAANHRRHHEHADVVGDPHSPWLEGGGPRTRLAGFWHAHAGWLMRTDSILTDPARYAADVYRDPILRAAHRLYFPIVALGLALPAAAGFLYYGSLHGALLGLLWGGFVRTFCVHHAVWSLGSFCHTFGSQDYRTTDRARNNAWVAIFTFGEGWHHNHHVFPSSARHGLEWWQLDLNYGFIRLLERCGLAWDVKQPSAHAKAMRRLTPRGQREPAIG